MGKSGVSNEGLLQLPPGLVVRQVLLIHDPGTQAEAELLLQTLDVARLPGDNMAAALLLDLLQIPDAATKLALAASKKWIKQTNKYI